MNTDIKFSNLHISRSKSKAILVIEKDLISIFGESFPTSIDKKGRIINIKNIKLNSSLSTRFTYQMWSLNFLYRTLKKSNDQFGTYELRKKVESLLSRTSQKLVQSSRVEDISSLITYLEQEQCFIKDGVIDRFYVRKNTHIAKAS
ncbi:hypothetical protein GCM10009430_43790 [Aquimarina litoralis]|uniref:Uncharacterized protein n=1 Tax=Aquimarina litoralis TaxID=584605 RepID=A0ABP3UGB3_9FLAO